MYMICKNSMQVGCCSRKLIWKTTVQNSNSSGEQAKSKPKKKYCSVQLVLNYFSSLWNFGQYSIEIGEQ